MKPKLFVILISMFLLAGNITAYGKTKVKSMDITIEIPTPGMTKKEGEKMVMTAAQTAYGDLFKTGDVNIYNISWTGEFDKSDGKQRFVAGRTYEAFIKISFYNSKTYIGNHVFKDGDYLLNDTMFKATVNGVKGKVLNSSPSFPIIQVLLSLTNSGKNEVVKVNAAESRYVKEKNLRMKTRKPYTTAEADATWIEKNAYDVVVINRDNKPKGGHDTRTISVGGKYPTYLYITKMILDLSDSDCVKNAYVRDYAGHLANSVSGPFNIREVWLSDKVDAADFVKGLNSVMDNPHAPGVKEYWTNSYLFFSAKATLFIPQQAAAAVLNLLAKTKGHPSYSIRTYTGDVYSAQKAGKLATQEICHKHNFTERIMAADRILRHATCHSKAQWYYSCSICGKCEHNANHTFNDGDAVGTNGHVYAANLANDEAYIGVNSAGEHVYWQSCVWCGKPYNYHQLNPTKQKFAGMDGTFAQFKKALADALELRESEAKIYSYAIPTTFTLPYKSEAKMSTAAQHSVNYAKNDNLLDTKVLGNDYTQGLSRIQLASLAVRLAEQLTGKAIPVGKRFADTDNTYAKKAAHMGLTANITGETFSPNAVVSRQEMATMIYRALRYVEKNSSAYKYTDYDSKLVTFTDYRQLKPWAKEAMDFMTALGLVEAQSGKNLAPDAPCTIEQAITLAGNSVYAHKIGWYQAIALGEKTESGWSTFINKTLGTNKYAYIPGGEFHSSMSVTNSERVWVIGLNWGQYDNWLPVLDPYTKQLFFLDGDWFRPIRD